MIELVRHMVKGLVTDASAVSVNAVEGEASVLIELRVAPADLDRVKGPDGETLRALRTVLSAGAGQRRAVLELIEPGMDNGVGGGESAESTGDEVTAE
ncbi:MAG: KH domain-containing protein [Deltaproteobacteria bacterium]|nr:KH domain-containing protein [Deltaproteobacteria bacterium]